jgi:hypothetical protein
MAASMPRALVVLLVLFVTAPARAQSGWSVDVSITSGPTSVAEARAALEAHLDGVERCARGSGPFRLVYSVTVGTSGGVREAAPDRSAGADLAPARAVRCVRHILEELDLPEHEEASRIVVTFALGGDAAAPAAAPTAPSAPSSAPTSPPVAAPRSGSGSVAMGSVTGASSGARSVLDAGLPALEACYATALGEAPALAGEGTLRLTVGADGHVSRALFAGGEALASAMALCLGSAARGWAFPSSPAETRLEVPLIFTP